MTFQEVSEIWKEGYELKVESTTADITMGYFRNHILPEFGKCPVDSITYFDCEQFMTKLTKKLKSSRKILFYFSRILKEAVQTLQAHFYILVECHLQNHCPVMPIIQLITILIKNST